MPSVYSREQIDELISLVKKQDSHLPQQETINKILDVVQGLEGKLDEQNRLIVKMVAMLSKMVQDGEINKDTFNKLDEFLKPYYDNSNLSEDY